MTTPFHAKYWAHCLLLSHPRDSVEALSRSVGNARVDLNPHQVDAAHYRADSSMKSIEELKPVLGLERLKLEDGNRVHEPAKLDLDVYAQQNDVRKVKPR